MNENLSSEARWQNLKGRLTTSNAPETVIHFARALIGTDDPDLSHSEFETQLPRYIAAEVGGLPAAKRYPDFRRHLDLCEDCEAEYIEVLQLALIDDAGELPMPASIPQPDLSFLPEIISLPDVVRSLTEHIISVLTPKLLPEFRQVADAFFQMVERQGGTLLAVRADVGTVLGIEEGTTSSNLLYLAAVQFATQKLDDPTPARIHTMIASGELQQIALEAGQKVGFNEEEASAFAQQYVASYSAK